MKNDLRVGCSGYYYSYWKNRFYPEGLQPKNWLEYYSTVFNTVELNGTFYRKPQLSSLKKYAAQTPDDFLFAVKMNKAVTHIQKLKDSRELITEFQDLIRNGLENKLAHFLFQLPPSFHYSEENLERILENIPHHPENVVELRHISWWNKNVETAFKKAGLTFCNVDFPGLKTHFIHTSDYFYMRFHGSPELFKSSYSAEELTGFIDQFQESAERKSIYFNNTYYEAGYTNARELVSLLNRPATTQELNSQNDSL